MQADVVHLDGGAVARRGGHGDLELARQEAELGVQRRPLADDLGVGARVGHLVGGGAGEVIGGDVADAVAGGLDGVHLDVGQLVQDVGDVGELGPVELQVLARGEVAGAAVVGARDVGELAQLARGQRAVGDGDAQHVGVQLQIDAVHEAQRLELVLGQLARERGARPGRGTAPRAGARTPRRTRRSGTCQAASASSPEGSPRSRGEGWVGATRRSARGCLTRPSRARPREKRSPARRRGCWGRRRARARGSGWA